MTRRERLEAKEDVIVNAAHHEFLKHGFDNARVANIARRAEVAEGTIYLYFKNKNALLVAVVGAFYDELTAAAADGVSELTKTRDRLSFLAAHHLKSCLAQWGILEQVAAAYRVVGGYRDSEYIAFNRAYVAVFDSVIREGIGRGDIRQDVPLAIIRDLFYGALEYSVRTYLIRGQDPMNQRQIEATSRDLMALITPGIGLQVSDRPGSELPDLESVTRRLERVATTLDAAAKD